MSWSFYDLETKLEYKAQAIGSKVIKVDAHYTSQRCPKCEIIDKSNRNHKLREYHCKCCGYQSNDDRIGAMNIQYLGIQFLSGIQKPKFEKIKKLG